MFSVIMAGGSGTRFWPLSRKARPKQLLALVGGRSLLRQTVDRLLPLTPAPGVLGDRAGHARRWPGNCPSWPRAILLASPWPATPAARRAGPPHGWPGAFPGGPWSCRQTI